MARRPFASLLAVAGIGLIIAAALLLIAFPPPLGDALRRCIESGGLCSSLVRAGREVSGPLVLALLSWSLCRGLGSGWQQWRATRGALARLEAENIDAPTAPLVTLGADLGLKDKVGLIQTGTPLAFCHGLWRPRIWLSTGTLALLEPAEIAAVLRHERAHLHGRHPLQLLVARSLAAAFPFLPALRELADALPRAQELVADRAVIQAGGRRALGRALLTLVAAQGGDAPPSLAPGMVGALDARIDQLTGTAPVPGRLSRRALLRTWLVLGAGVLLLRLGTLGLDPQRALLALPVGPPMGIAFPWRCLLVSTLLCAALQGTWAALASVRRRTPATQPSAYAGR